MTLRLCRVCRDFHELEEAWPEACYGHFPGYSASNSITIIKDISPYQAVAIDKRTGKAPKIGSRREHKEFLRANGYREVGNEPIRQPPSFEVQDSRREIKMAIDKIKGEGRWR